MGSSNSHVVVGIALLVVVLIISPVIIILVRKVTRTLQVSARPSFLSGSGQYQVTLSGSGPVLDRTLRVTLSKR